MPKPSAAATYEFLENLGKFHPDISLAHLFIESVRRLNERGLSEKDDILDFAASGMKERIAAKLKGIEENLDYIDFRIFAEEAAKAMRALKTVIRTPEGKEIGVALPPDISKIAAGIAGSWKDAANLSLMMANVAESGGRAEAEIPSGPEAGKGPMSLSCERIDPPGRSRIWERCRKLLAEMLKWARNAVLTVIGATILLAGAAKIGTAIKAALPFTNTHAVSEISGQFGRDWEKGRVSPRETDESCVRLVKDAIDDPEFASLLKEVPVLSFLMGRLDGMRDDPMGQIDLVNRFWNRLDGIDDMDNYGKSEHWAKPSEMWRNFGGDCEDYAIIKYVTLRISGFRESDLHILVTHDRESDSGHAILAAKVNGEFFVLDNMHENVITMKEAAEKYELRHSANEKCSATYTARAAASAPR